MTDLLVAAPMRIEAALISSAGRRAALVRKTGMGPKRSRAAAGVLAADSGRAMLVLGFCGGLDETSVPGEVIVAQDVYAAQDEGHAEQRVRCDLHDQLVHRLTGRGLKVRAGDVVCVSRLALGDRRAELHAGGAIAVDMESVWLAQAAGGRPFAVVRVVSDTPARELTRRLPAVPPLPAVADGLRAIAALRRAAGAVEELVCERGVRAVFSGEEV
jgi:4-hydroxy-3-methylbut-2-enyl diphosphate reductase